MSMGTMSSALESSRLLRTTLRAAAAASSRRAAARRGGRDAPHLTTNCGCQRSFPSRFKPPHQIGDRLKDMRRTVTLSRRAAAFRGAAERGGGDRECAARAGKSRLAAGLRQEAGRRRDRAGSAQGHGRPARRGRAQRQPGRLNTAIGRVAAMRCQSRQRWKLARLSAPIIQTQWTPGRRGSRRAQRLGGVGGAERGLDAGDPDARVAGQRAGGGDAAGEVVDGAFGFSGFCGETSHQTWSRRRRRSADQADRAGGPSWGGIEGAAEQADAHAGLEGRQAEVGQRRQLRATLRSVAMAASRPHLTGAADAVLEAGQLLDADRARGHACGRWRCRSRRPCRTRRRRRTGSRRCAARSPNRPRARNRSAAAWSSVTMESVWCEP